MATQKANGNDVGPEADEEDEMVDEEVIEEEVIEEVIDDDER
jgi:hypothetical protein